MSIAKKGARSIVVDGTPFRWRVRSKPTYSQALADSPLTVAVEHEGGESVLVLVFDAARPDNWMGESIAVATPGDVTKASGGRCCSTENP